MGFFWTKDARAESVVYRMNRKRKARLVYASAIALSPLIILAVLVQFPDFAAWVESLQHQTQFLLMTVLAIYAVGALLFNLFLSLPYLRAGLARLNLQKVVHSVSVDKYELTIIRKK